MPFKIIRNDITRVRADAIVNAANNSLLGGGGVDGAIHRAAGPRLLEECRTLGGCDTGQAKITGGYDMPCRYIIHTVGPVWRGGGHGEPELLYSCYMSSLRLAQEHGCESIAFPLISAGIYGYPKDKALDIAVTAIREHLAEHDMDVTLVVFDRSAVVISKTLADEVEQYIDDNYADTHYDRVSDTADLCAPMPADPDRLGSSSSPGRPGSPGNSRLGKSKKARSPLFDMRAANCVPEAAVMEETLSDADIFAELDESFSEALLRMIDERGLTDPQVYKKANVDRRLFSKIRSNRAYRPSKETAVAFAIALELDSAQTDELLKKAGFTLSNSIKFDVIVRYFIEHRDFDMYTINETLFTFDQPLIGC
ncbi:MAG: O-acetyl-ADP-ribose deacetylase [Oscillospiraceae bacterium]|nr:O-acetyl-ADP-ribose deacetylase [Oscillospiraceae bacterium]